MTKQYILKAETKNIGTAYFVNDCNLVFKKELAKTFPCVEEAEDHMGYFKRIFCGETPKFSIEEV